MPIIPRDSPPASSAHALVERKAGEACEPRGPIHAAATGPPDGTAPEKIRSISASVTRSIELLVLEKILWLSPASSLTARNARLERVSSRASCRRSEEHT